MSPSLPPLFFPSLATTMSVSLPLVRNVVLGEILPIFVSAHWELDVSVVRDDQRLRFDRSRSWSIHHHPNGGRPGLLLHLFCPWCLHLSPSLVFRERCVSPVLCMRLPKINVALPRLIIGSLRDGAFTSRVSYQVGWLSYLCIMWLATGAQTAATFGIFLGCDLACVYFPPLSRC